MKMYLRTLGAAAIAAGILAVPSVAQAADDTPNLVALTERDEAGSPISYPIHQGESIPVVLGVANIGSAASAGVVVNIRVADDVDLPRTFTNCQYFVDSNVEGAWCELDQELAANSGSYALTPFQVSAAPAARADHLPAIVSRWFSKSWADERGGITGLAKSDSGQGTTPAAGSAGALSLAAKQLIIPADGGNDGFAYVKLVTAPTSTPTSTASTTPTPAPTSSSSAAPDPSASASGTQNGLPVTGGNTVALGVTGATLLVAGVVALLVARRRRARSIA